MTPIAGISGIAERPGVFRVIPGATNPSSDTINGRLWDELLRQASTLGFTRAGVTHAGPLDAAKQRLKQWLADGYSGDMAYLQKAARHRPTDLLPEAKSAIVVALAHNSFRGSPEGQVAKYAQGDDYHHVLKRKLLELAAVGAELSGRELRVRPCVDTAPLLERSLAERAGLGFQGKSTMLILPGVGTRVLLGTLLTDLPLPPRPLPLSPGSGNSNSITSGCGQCTRCLDQCPTKAFPKPYQLDSRRCISYLTLETSAPVPTALREPMGQHLAGCDVCQQVCPFNASQKGPPAAAELVPHPELAGLSAETALSVSSSEYRRLTQGTALRRLSRPMLQRNAAVALGNGPSPAGLERLTRSLNESSYALVREHAAWAIGNLAVRFPRVRARALLSLQAQLELETEPRVTAELGQALSRLQPV